MSAAVAEKTTSVNCSPRMLIGGKLLTAAKALSVLKSRDGKNLRNDA